MDFEIQMDLQISSWRIEVVSINKQNINLNIIDRNKYQVNTIYQLKLKRITAEICPIRFSSTDVQISNLGN